MRAPPPEEILARCPVCDGGGEIIRAGVTGRWDMEPNEWAEPCEFCEGTGRAFVEAEPVTLADLEFRDFLEWTHDAIQGA